MEVNVLYILLIVNALNEQGDIQENSQTYRFLNWINFREEITNIIDILFTQFQCIHQQAQFIFFSFWPSSYNL